jgi:hypothetical protein
VTILDRRGAVHLNVMHLDGILRLPPGFFVSRVAPTYDPAGFRVIVHGDTLPEVPPEEESPLLPLLVSSGRLPRVDWPGQPRQLDGLDVILNALHLRHLGLETDRVRNAQLIADALADAGLL